MKILIVGAGLGGLSAALCFARRGHAVELLEQRPDLSPAGGGLHIRPPATRILHSWALRPDLERIAEDTAAAVYRSLRTGKVATRAVAENAAEDPDWGARRADVVALLHRRAREAGAEVRFGVVVLGVRDAEAGAEAIATARAPDGKTHELGAHMILASDGVRSRLRAQVLADLPGGPFEPLTSDLTLYGVDLPLLLHPDPERPGDAALADPRYLNVYLGDEGRGAVARAYPKLGRLGVLLGVRGATDQTGLWDERGDIAFVRERFADACPEIRDALGRAAQCDRWKLTEMPELPRWTSKGGRVVLLGDCAHSMHPNAAQGYSQIVEDIGVLEYLVSQVSSTPSPDSDSDPDSDSGLAAAKVPRITSAWEEIRKPRVRRIQEWARFNSALFTGEPAAAAAKLRKPQQTTKGKSDDDSQGYQVRSLKDIVPDMNADFGTSAFLKWTQSYDAVDEARKYLQSNKSRL